MTKLIKILVVTVIMSVSGFAAATTVNGNALYQKENKIAKMYGSDIYVINNAEKNKILKIFHFPPNRVEFIGKRKTKFGFIEYILKDKMSDRTQIIYAMPNRDYYILGYVLDAKTGKNLTLDRTKKYLAVSHKRQLKINEKKNKEILSFINQAKFKDIVIHVKGKGTGSIVLFTDPACPFCKKFEKLAFDYIANKYGDITIVLFPLKRIHPEALDRSVYFLYKNRNVTDAQTALNNFKEASRADFAKIMKFNKSHKNYKQFKAKIDTLTDGLMQNKDFYGFGVPTVLNGKGDNIRAEVSKNALQYLIQKMEAQKRK